MPQSCDDDNNGDNNTSNANHFPIFYLKDILLYRKREHRTNKKRKIQNNKWRKIPKDAKIGRLFTFKVRYLSWWWKKNKSQEKSKIIAINFWLISHNLRHYQQTQLEFGVPCCVTEVDWLNWIRSIRTQKHHQRQCLQMKEMVPNKIQRQNVEQSFGNELRSETHTHTHTPQWEWITHWIASNVVCLTFVSKHDDEELEKKIIQTFYGREELNHILP